MKTKPDVVLLPNKRKNSDKRRALTAPTYSGRRPIVATVMHIDWFDGGYSHPVLAIGTVDADGERDYFTGINVTYQRNAIAAAVNYDRVSRGFLGNGTAGHCYAGRVEVRLDRLHDDGAWMRIIERAYAAGRKAGARTGCDLTRLIVGLRLIGVEVRIWNKPLGDRRYARLANRNHDRLAEVA